ncbi:MAG: hypothetical protein ACLGIZ_12380 [Acidimicrobiia bacterium]|jgi:hypothetical protein
MSITAGTDHATIARVAIDRAQALRNQAASLRSPALAPLRAALHVRAGELELAAAALDQPVAEPTRHLQAIA